MRMTAAMLHGDTNVSTHINIVLYIGFTLE